MSDTNGDGNWRPFKRRVKYLLTAVRGVSQSQAKLGNNYTLYMIMTSLVTSPVYGGSGGSIVFFFTNEPPEAGRGSGGSLFLKFTNEPPEA